MARKRRGKGFFRSMVDFPTWMNVKNLRESGDGIAKTFRSLQEVPLFTRQETFEEAVARLGLDEKSIQKRIQQCLLSAWIYLACSVALFIYGICLLIFTHFTGAFIAWLLAVLAGVFAYREAFWYCQMKKRKLGCSFNEFLNFISRRK
jgi:intracellular multiplication protein IcmV